MKLGGWRGGSKVDGTIGRKAIADRADAFAASVGPIVSALRAEGQSLRQIAAVVVMPRDAALRSYKIVLQDDGSPNAAATAEARREKSP